MSKDIRRFREIFEDEKRSSQYLICLLSIHLQEHNKFRASVHPTAANMLKMVSTTINLCGIKILNIINYQKL